MTTTADPAPRPRPLLSVWRSPRDTIELILRTNPRHLVLLLAVVTAVSELVFTVIDRRLAAVLLDWRIDAAIIVGGAVLGVVTLYVSAWLIAWCGRRMGGRASALELRAVLAWGGVPALLGLALCGAVVIALKLFGGTLPPERTEPVLNMVLGAVSMVLAAWSLVVTLLMLGRVQRFGFWRTVISYALGSLLALVVIEVPLLFRTFAYQPFNAPSGSMMPTLLIGDYFFVAKYSYGYTHYSLPFSPRLFSGRVLAAEPQRGDVVVFRLPKDDTTDYVKRLVGLPGDRIQMIGGRLHINGVAVQRERVDDFVDTDGGSEVRAKRWRETLPNGRSYETLDLQDNGLYDNTDVYVVPPGHYFMMGDNRDNSTDSRVLSQVGYVPFENLIGRVEVVFLSTEAASGTWQTSIRFDRFGLVVR